MKRVKNSIAFTMEHLLAYIKENNIKTCGVVSTINKNKVVLNFLNAACENLKSKGQDASASLWNQENVSSELAFIYYDKMLEDYDCLSKLKNCDCVIFIEKYGVSKHKTIDEMLDILNIQGITPYGVIALK